MRRSFVVAALLAAACGQQPASRPPVLGESRDFALVATGDLAPGVALGTETRQVAVAAGREAWLVVWSRPGLGGEDLVGLRVAPSGEPLDAEPFVISGANGDEQSPAVAFDGERWLVAWQDHRVGPLMNIYAARVAEDGTVLDPDGIALCTQEDHQRAPAAAFVDGVFVVVWEDRRAATNWDIYGARVGTDGIVLDPGGFPVSTAAGHQISPAIAAGGGVALAVWQGESIHGARIAAGGPLAGAPIVVADAAGVESSPTVAYADGRFVVAWQDLQAGAASNVRGARVTPDGEVLDSAGLSLASGPLAEFAPAATFDARHAVVAWAAGTAGSAASLEATRLDAAGAIQDDPPFAIAGGALGRSLAIAADGEGRVLVVHDALDGLGGVALRGRVLTTWAELEVARGGRGGGVVTSAPAGIDCGTACEAVFDGGATVTLTAAPDGDSVFGGWSGACSGSGPCTVTMDEAREVTATFLPLLAVDVAISGPSGSVTSSPAGIACPGACSARFPEGTTVQLAPAATPGQSTFSGWSEACSGSGPCTLVVDAPKRATATFAAARTLTLYANGQGQGTLSTPGASCANGSSCGVDLPLGSSATVTATPAEGSILKTWTGCLTTSGPTCTVSMTSARNVFGRFDPSTWPLTVMIQGPNNGFGLVTGAGLACASGSSDGCTAAVPNPPFTPTSATPTLRATPNPGSVFKSWTGCTPIAGDPAACVVTMSGPKTVSAKFEAATLPLNGFSSGTGAGSITGGGLDCPTGGGAGCTAAVENPNLVSTYTTVTLRAVPVPGSVFKSWTGCTAVAGDPAACTITVNGPKYVTAKFEPALLPVTANVNGAGAGTVTGAGLSCATGAAEGCAAQVENPANSAGYTTITLRASPADGSVFKSWTSCIAVAGDPRACTLVVSGPKFLSAKFEPATFPLTAQVTGTGAGRVTGAGLSCETGVPEGCTSSTTNLPDSSSYATVTLRAAPLPGSVFKAWTGCIAVPGDPAACTITANGAKYVGARFEPAQLPVTFRSTGGGGGTVSGPGFTCPATPEGCTVYVANPPNTNSYDTITIAATPDASSVMKSWTGCYAGADPATCSLRVDGVENVTVRLEPSSYALTVAANGPGSVAGPGIACSAETPDGCRATAANGATVRLTGTPAEGYILKSWYGCTPAADGTCSVVMSGAKYVSATFQPATYGLTVGFSGAGAGSVSAGDAVCASSGGAPCTFPQPNGATVTLSPAAEPGSRFTGWSGSCSGTGPCTVIMSMARTVYAGFATP